ncbi:MAG: hypothetical protein U0Z44_09005 [Kouleothrix sp.]
MPSKDLYIEKEAQINEEIDRLRHAATQALLTRNDVLIVASVSAIWAVWARPPTTARSPSPCVSARCATATSCCAS